MTRFSQSSNIRLSLFSVYTDNEEYALMLASRAVFDEAFAILASATTLKIYQNSVLLRSDPLSKLDPSFLGLIQEVEVDWSAFPHVGRKDLKSLKKITLVAEAEGFFGSEDGQHWLTCPACGGSNNQIFIDEVMSGKSSWKWFKDQIAYLSKEEGWQAFLSARIDYARAGEEDVYVVSWHMMSWFIS